jgi:transcriptional regulator with XRE-family HTH domain
METMEKAPPFIAQQVKFLRQRHKLTQENRADAAGLTTRTIEKVESGRHRPDEQTLRSIARAFHVNVAFFEKPTAEAGAKQRADMERALRKMVLTPTHAIRTASDFVNIVVERHAYRIDTSAVENEEALEIAATMADFITEMNDVWPECSFSQRLDAGREFAHRCSNLETQGYLCHVGHHLQRLRQKGKRDLVFDVGVMSIQPAKGAEGTRYALIELDGAWESMEADRGPFPDGEWPE